MKKVIQASVIILVTIFASCKKNSDAPVLPALQNPLEGYLAASGFNQRITTFKNDNDYEFGYCFIPTVNGKITSIVAKIPDIHTGMRVTIWDKATAAAIRTELIDVTIAGEVITKAITPLDLTKDKEYVISMNSNDYYIREKTDQKEITYPVTSGDIKITGYRFTTGVAQTFPSTARLDYYAGDLSFTFQK